MTTSAKKGVIIGLAGTLGAGKDTVGHLLANMHGFLHVSTSDMLRAAKKKSFGDTPEALLLRNDPFANELRATKGPGVLVELAIEEYISRQDDFSGGLVASGIRSIGEVESIHEAKGVMVFVDADPKVRFQRTSSRKRDANEHKITFQEFLDAEQTERPSSNEDKTVQNLNAMKDMADIVIENNGNDIASFEKEVETILSEYLDQ